MKRSPSPLIPESSTSSDSIMEFQKLVFVDEDSMQQGFRLMAEQLCARERKLVESFLPAPYMAMYSTIGFCRGKPVQILAPYAVPLGLLRKQWIEAFLEVR